MTKKYYKPPTIANPGNPDIFGDTTYIRISQEFKAFLIAHSKEDERLGQTAERLARKGLTFTKIIE